MGALLGIGSAIFKGVTGIIGAAKKGEESQESQESQGAENRGDSARNDNNTDSEKDKLIQALLTLVQNQQNPPSVTSNGSRMA